MQMNIKIPNSSQRLISKRSIFISNQRPSIKMSTFTPQQSFSTTSTPQKQGFITGYYCDKPSSGSTVGTPQFSLTSTILSNSIKDSIKNLLECTNAEGKKDERRIFYQVDSTLPFQLAATSVGTSYTSTLKPTTTTLYDKRENVRKAVANAVRSLSTQGIKEYILDSFSDAQAAVEGAILASYSYLKFKENSKSLSFKIAPGCSSTDIQSFKSGFIMASAQNITRYLADTPANLCTPTKFVEFVEKFSQEHLSHVAPFLKIEAKDASWAKEQGMNSFLSVSHGSVEPCKFLIMEYYGQRANGSNSPHEEIAPIGLIGKGVTFDSGGISLKPSADMASMKADMQGAAIIATSFLTAALCKLPLNIVVAIPLTENLPSGTATKPGDVVTASNGKTIEV